MKLLNTPTFDDNQRVLDRLWGRDATLWSRDPATQRDIKDRLGWLDAAAFIRQHRYELESFGREIKNQGYEQVLLMGMGGSSLAPEVFSHTFSRVDGFPTLIVLDTTSPVQIRSVSEACESRRTLFVVSSKSGTTAETDALFRHFLHWSQARDLKPKDHFVAITDPGSALHILAQTSSFRSVFLNPQDIGGRYSALSYFGLLPAALLGIDLRRIESHIPNRPDDPVLSSLAAPLGRALGASAQRGRNKLILNLASTASPMAAWIEQLIDESTGKQGKGIVVVEHDLSAAATGTDRFMIVVNGEQRPSRAAGDLRETNAPVAQWTFSDPHTLGREFFIWEVATAIAGAQMGINPFDEPDVDSSKARTRVLLGAGHDDSGTPTHPDQDLVTFLKQSTEGDYLAVLAYLAQTDETRQLLRGWCQRLNTYTGLPVTFGFGPRYLHSSGQLHKGGPDQGLFIFITTACRSDLPIPGENHGFRSLMMAQALGDIETLKSKNKRTCHLSLNTCTEELERLLEQQP